MGNIGSRGSYWEKDMSLRSCRKAAHAGILYNNNAEALSKQLGTWLSEAEYEHGPARAIIVPHSRYSESGACAAAAYRQVRPDLVKRIFILAPTHNYKFDRLCNLTQFEKFETPLYDIPVDIEMCSELCSNFHCQYIDKEVDENEYSIEMQLPFIAKIMENYRNQYKIVPLYVGSIGYRDQEKYGHIFAPCLLDPENLFIVSTDLCHFLPNHNYSWKEPSKGVRERVEWLDRMGMDIIESMDTIEFIEYMHKYNNTICGHRAISTLLQIRDKTESELKMSLKFLKYIQNYKNEETITSYGSASFVIEDKTWKRVYQDIVYNISFWN